MVKITNGKETFEVTRGAFKTVFERQGYRLFNDHEVVSQDEPGDTENTKDQTFVEEIVKKPLSEWSQEEIKHFASIEGISLEGITKVAQAREIVASYLGQ